MKVINAKEIYDLFALGEHLPNGKVALHFAHSRNNDPRACILNESTYYAPDNFILIFNPFTGEVSVENQWNGKALFVHHLDGPDQGENLLNSSSSVDMLPGGFEVDFVVYIAPQNPIPGKWCPSDLLQAHLVVTNQPGECLFEIIYDDNRHVADVDDPRFSLKIR